MNSLIAASRSVKLTKGRLDHTAAVTMGHFSTTLPKIFTKSSYGRVFTVAMSIIQLGILLQGAQAAFTNLLG